MRELSVQSANDTNNDSDRASLQAEVAQLKSELDRIAETTNFNGNKILNGNFLSQDIQVGANVGETINVSIEGMSTTDMARQVRVNTAEVGGTVLGGTDIKFISSMPGADPAGSFIRGAIAADDQVSTSLNARSAISMGAAINSSTEFTGVRAIVGESSVTMTNAIAASTLDGTDFITLNDQKITGFEVQANDADGSLKDAINAVSDETGVVATLDKDSKLVLTASDGRNIEFSTSAAGIAGNALAVDLVEHGTLTLQSDYQFDIEHTAAGHTALGLTPFAAAGGAGTIVMGVNSDKSVTSVDISSRGGAVEALDVIDLALENVSAARADLGALQNRLESTINNLSTTSENLSASRSRILDADFAQETAQLSRNQIIQQAGVSILAQANQQPQIALSLLG
jgi:flagellin